MNIGLLNVRITILQNVMSIDAIGNHINAWEEYFSCYATVSGEAGKEATAAGLVVDESSIDFTIRWCNRVATINSTQFRVQFNDELYDIKAIDHQNYKRKGLKLRCEKVRR